MTNFPPFRGATPIVLLVLLLLPCHVGLVAAGQTTPKRAATPKRAFLLVFGKRANVLKRLYRKNRVSFLRELAANQRICIAVQTPGRATEPFIIQYDKKEYSRYLSKEQLSELNRLAENRFTLGSESDSTRVGSEVCEIADPSILPDVAVVRQMISKIRTKKKRQKGDDPLLRLLAQKLDEWRWLRAARRLTRMSYFQNEHLPPSRNIRFENGIWMIEAWSMPASRSPEYDGTGWYVGSISSFGREHVRWLIPNKDFTLGGYVLKDGKVFAKGIKVRTAANGKTRYEIPPITRPARRLAATLYQKLLRSVSKSSKRGSSVVLPVSQLGVGPRDLGAIGDPSPVWKRIDDLTKQLMAYYRTHPSDLRVLATLELALVERDLGKVAQSRDRLKKAVKQYKLAEMDFRGDAAVRKKLTFATPFLRPEVAMLFLAAEDARRDGNTEQAAKWYRALLERAPVSPYAWESLVRLRMMPGVKVAEIGKQQERLLSFYPCVWGYGEYRTTIPPGQEKPFGGMVRDEFARKHLPGMLTAVEKEVRAVDAWLKQAPKGPPRQRGSE